MMTLKVWNTLDDNTRETLADVCGHPTASKRYHHNFDYNSEGRKLKEVLEKCYLRPSDGKIVVSLEFMPKYEKEPEKAAKPAKTKVNLQSMVSTFSDALKAVPELLKKYGEKPYNSAENTNKVIYVGNDTEFKWNHQILKFEIYRGKVSFDIYWQGDLTDGDEWPMLDSAVYEIQKNGSYVIRAEHEFVNGYTRERHGDIRVSRDELWAAIRAMVKVIETKQNG